MMGHGVGFLAFTHFWVFFLLNATILCRIERMPVRTLLYCDFPNFVLKCSTTCKLYGVHGIYFLNKNIKLK